MDGLLRYHFEGLVHGGVYFRNITVHHESSIGCLSMQ